jgi:NADPH:quinone reductase-like Zn-dependent oxidoreductase
MTVFALRIDGGEDPARLSYEEAPVPKPGTGDVLVRVHAASFTPTELSWPSTWVDRQGHDRRPVIVGHEVSGTVAALGRGTTGFAVGEEVYGLTDWYRDGALAEYVAVEARNLAPKPASLDHVQAAALPMPGLTAWQALFLHGRLSRGQRVLLHGAAGGVGSMAVQLARAAGAHVIATGRARARGLVAKLGAERFVDLDRERLADLGEMVDVVIDLVGGDILRRSTSLIRQGGIAVSAVTAGVPEADGTRAVYFVVEPSRPQLEELARRADAGELHPMVGAVFDLRDGRAAFTAKANGGVPGKTVIRVRVT